MGTSIDPVTRDLLVVLAYLERGTLYDLLHNEVGLTAQRKQRGLPVRPDLLLLCLRVQLLLPAGRCAPQGPRWTFFCMA